MAPADGAVLRRRDALLTRALDAAAALDPGTAGPDAAAGRVVVDAALADGVAGRLTLDDERVVALATALANVVLDRAERARPGHRLAATVRAAVGMGIPPQRIRECLDVGRQPAPVMATRAPAPHERRR